MKREFLSRIKKIKLLILDVDGVLTSGKIVLDARGSEIKDFDVYDGLGIVIFQKLGFKTAILSARSATAVTARAKDLKINMVCQDAYPKINVYKRILSHFKVKDEEVCFIADDLTDLAVFKRVGLAVAVSNARDEIKEQAHYITKRSGGQGAIRETIELILKSQNLWKKVLEIFN